LLRISVISTRQSGSEAGCRKALAGRVNGPEQLDNMVSDIRLSYVGPLRLAHDLMRIEL
jgi:hypothetical protein